MFGEEDDDWEYVPKGLTENQFEENLDYLKNHPLFMKELPKDLDKNQDLEGLHNLLYDEEPIKIAQHMNVKI